MQSRRRCRQHLEERCELGDADGGEAAAVGRQVCPLAHAAHGARQLRRQLLRRRQALQHMGLKMMRLVLAAGVLLIWGGLQLQCVRLLCSRICWVDLMSCRAIGWTLSR